MKAENITSIFKKSKRESWKLQASLTSAPAKIMKQVLLEAISGHMKKVTGNIQHGFTTGKSMLDLLDCFPQ